MKLIFISSQAIRRVLHEEVLPHYKLHEFFTMDIEIILRDFKRAIEGSYTVVQIKYEVIRSKEKLIVSFSGRIIFNYKSSGRDFMLLHNKYFKG